MALDLVGKSKKELDDLQAAAERALFLNSGKEHLVEFAKQMMPETYL